MTDLLFAQQLTICCHMTLSLTSYSLIKTFRMKAENVRMSYLTDEMRDPSGRSHASLYSSWLREGEPSSRREQMAEGEKKQSGCEKLE